MDLDHGRRVISSYVLSGSRYGLGLSAHDHGDAQSSRDHGDPPAPSRSSLHPKSGCLVRFTTLLSIMF